MLNRIYRNIVIKEKNGMIIFFTLIIFLMISVIILGILKMHFFEVYKTTGTVVPSHIHSLSLNYDAYIKENYIVIGKEYLKGSPFVIFNKEMLNRDNDYYTALLQYKTKRYNKTRKIISAVDADTLLFEIEEIKYKLSNINDIIIEGALIAPYNAVVISSNYDGISSGFIEKGKIVCTIGSTDTSLIKVEITDHWTEKVEEKKQCIIKTKNSRLRGEVDEVKIYMNADIYYQYAFIKINDRTSEQVKPGTDVVIHIITEKLTILEMIQKSL